MPGRILRTPLFAAVTDNCSSGRVKPLLDDAPTDVGLDNFLNDCRGAKRRIIVVCRGRLAYMRACDTPRSANDVPAIVTALLALQHGATIYTARDASRSYSLEPFMICVPHLSRDFRQLFQNVDLVIHHGKCGGLLAVRTADATLTRDTGGSGTTFTAYEAGVPQIIVPNADDTLDQIIHGSQVAALGCGVLLPPRTSLDSYTGDVIDAAKGILSNYATMRANCRNAQQKLGPVPVQDGISLATHTLGRLIQHVAAQKDAGTWEGWTPGESRRSALEGSDEQGI